MVKAPRIRYRGALETPMLTLLPLLAPMLACTSDIEKKPADPDGTTPTDETTPLPQPAPLAEVTGGDCPDLTQAGEFEITSNGVDRSGLIYFPEEPEGPMPVIFAWHPLGASASLMKRYLDLEDLAEDLGAVTIVPEGDPGNLLEWGFLGGGDNDLALYDDMRTCVAEQHEVDLSRVSSTGFSAGALWTTFLSMQRADTLSTILLFSGGTEPVMGYDTPSMDFPALLLHGGESDTWGGAGVVIDFEASTLAFAEDLYTDGHYVAIGNHDRGHTIPNDGVDIAAAWLTAHQYGAPSPFAEGDITEVADWLEVYKPE